MDLLQVDGDDIPDGNHFTSKRMPDASKRIRIPHFIDYEVGNLQYIVLDSSLQPSGIMILEILTKKFLSQYLIASNKSGGIDVVQWVASAIVENREAELLDPKITNCENAKDAMVQFLRIGVACAEANLGIKQDIKGVLRRVEEIAELNPNSHEAKTIQLLPSLRDGIC
ncbi:hypothetical protein Droror1_Dr00017669 [Drosera rotundifolia]